MEKQTAGRTQLGDFAPKLRNLMMMYYLGKYGVGRNNSLYEIDH